MFACSFTLGFANNGTLFALVHFCGVELFVCFVVDNLRVVCLPLFGFICLVYTCVNWCLSVFICC